MPAPRGPGVDRRRPGPFAANLALLIHHRGMSSPMLSDLLGEPAARINRLARGATEPHYNEIPRLARALQVSAADLAWLPTALLRARLRMAGS